MGCICKEWKNGKRQLDNMILLADVHGIKYTASQFRFCPWCGVKLP